MTDKIKRHIEDKYTDPFAEYFISGEPCRADKVYVWQTAIGLQDVDKLQPSEYLLNTAKDNIEGDISIEEARLRIESYYKENDGCFRASILMPEGYVIIISPRRNGCLTVHL